MSGGRDPHAYGVASLVRDHRVPRLPPPDPRLRVGVIDTGYAFNTWLDDHMEQSEDELVVGDDHGTFVAGVILTQEPSATIRMRRAVVAGPEDDPQVIRALEEFHAAGIKLINLSFSGGVFEQGTPPRLREVLDALIADDVVVVAAAANNALPLRTYPAADADILAVGASTVNGEIAEFSACGRWIDVFAQGQDVVGPIGEGFSRWSGTSFAAAMVTGRIANLMKGQSAVEAKKVLLANCEAKHAWGVNGPFNVKVMR